MQRLIRPNHLTLYRRHKDSCGLKSQNLANCDCPLWVYGRVGIKPVRQSLETRSLGTAEAKRAEMLRRGNGPEDPTPAGGRIHIAGESDAPVTIEAAEASFNKNKSDKASNTRHLYAITIASFRSHAASFNVTYLRDVTPSLIQSFVSKDVTWAPSTKRSYLTNLRVFFNYCQQMDWITRSAAGKKSLNVAQPKNSTREPFTPDQVTAILTAIERLDPETRPVARAVILLMLSTGMRISDATFAQRSSITKTNCIDYIAIKGHARIPLAPEVHAQALAALNMLPPSRVFFFQPDRDDDYREPLMALAGCRGATRFSAALGKPDYETAIRKNTAIVAAVLDAAGIQGKGISHRFRDTFAINMLVGGADIFTVSQMLGHSDVRITAKHYLKLVPGYRERMSQATRVLDYHFPAFG